MNNIMHMLDVIDKVRDHMALGLMSDPGLSKTAQVKQWADENNRRYCELIISQRMPSEISGMPMPVTETQKMEIFDFETLLKLEDGDVLAFDEFTNGNIQTLNACLTLIQERTMLSGKRLPSLIIVAMGNPQGKCELLPQTKQRFWWVNVSWDSPTWKAYMAKRWGITVQQSVLQFITDQYQRGFSGDDSYNYHTPRTIENLFRIAMTVDADDPFWETSDVDRVLVTGLYTSIAGRDEFDNLLGSLTDWVRMNPEEEWSKINPATAPPKEWNVDTSQFTLLYNLTRCMTMEQLRELIDQTEKAGTHPRFIEFLKTKTEVDDE